MKNSDNKTILISGYYGFGNAGDEAILAAMMQQFKEQIPGVRIIVLSETPKSTSEQFGIESFSRTDFRGIFRLMSETDVFVSGGGGLVQDSTGFNTVLYYLGLVEMAKLRGKKVMLYAQGLGPVNLKSSRMVARFIMNQADVITYRDEKSKLLSEKLKITKPPIHVTADPVFALHPPSPEILQPIVEKEGLNTEKFKLGISVRPWESEVDYIELLALLADSYIKENDAEVFIFPFQESQDMEICEKLRNKMQSPARIIPRNYSIPEMLGLMGKMDMIAGMRLHALIFSIIQGVPCIGISYDPKVSILMGMMGLPWIDVKSFSRNDLFNAAAEVYLKKIKIREEILLRSEDLRKQANRNVEFLKVLLNK
jgi:polysaccharide pyruvyl transferase CsaB